MSLKPFYGEGVPLLCAGGRRVQLARVGVRWRGQRCSSTLTGVKPRVGSSPPLCPIIMNPPQHIKVISARYGQWVNCADDAQIWNALEAVCLAGSAQKQRIFLSVFGAAFLEQNLPRI